MLSPYLCHFFVTVNLHQLPVLNRTEQGGVPECSVITVGSSNQVDMSWASSSCGIGSRAASTGAEEKCARKISPCSERETVGQAITSCSGGTSQSNTHKRKSRDVEESECRSDVCFILFLILTNWLYLIMKINIFMVEAFLLSCRRLNWSRLQERNLAGFV